MKTSKQKKSAQVAATSGKPTVISLFAGTGGSSLGYKWAGFHELLAVDFDPHAVECFRLNFPDVPVWQRSVVEVTGKEILEFCKIKKGELDVLDGSPPCQGFSTAGKRNVTDPRNDLFKHYVRLINELQPKVFVMENVSGMAKGKMKGRFIEIINALKATGYNVKAKQMNAANYGVPQSRERIIFIGSRKDLKNEVTYPVPNGVVITARDAIDHLYDSEKKNRKPVTKGLLAFAKMLKEGEYGSRYHPTGSLFGLIRIASNKPCPTVTKSAGTVLLHYRDSLMFLSVNELKVLCSFPIEWKLGSSRSKSIDRLGNAVMPKFMQAIAEQVKLVL